MSLPNPEVYGTSETWSKCAIFYAVGNGDSTTKTIAPQINVWDSTSLARRKGTLSRAINAGKAEAGVPIDPTICPCGQDPAVSCFGKIGLFKNHSNTDDNKVPDKVISYENPVNWFFSEIWNYGIEGRGFTPQLTNRNSKLQRWAPDGNLSDYTNNNRYVTPFVYYQLKSIFGNIVVNTITGYDNMGRPYGAVMSLEDWKNNHPERKVMSCALRLKGVNSYTGGTINYLASNLDPELSVGVSLLNDVDGITDYYTYYADRVQEIRLFSDLYSNAYNTGDTYYMLGYDMFENVEVKSVFEAGQTQGGWRVWQEVPYSEANYKKIMKMAACFGIPFSPTTKETFAAEFTDNDLYLPVIDENGIAHGEYTHGLRNVANSLYDMDGIRDIDYDPSQNVDPNTYSSQTYFNQVLNLASMTRRYVLDGSAVEQLGKDLWQISDDLAHVDPTDTFKNYENLIVDNFLTNNPIDCIISLDKYPILNIPTGTQAEPIKYGKVTGAAKGKPFYTTSYFFNFEGVRIFPKFGKSFLDYEPYTHYELYVPFCGTIQIDPGDIIDRILSVIMCIDFSTGTVTAYVMADNLCINTLNGSCSINIPVTGTDGVTLNSQINNGIINTKKAQGNLFLGGFLNMFTIGGIGKLALDPTSKANQIMQGSLDKAQAVYDLKHTEVPMHTIGSASPVGSWSLELTCRLMIYYPEGEAIDSSGGVSSTSPKLADLTEYGHTTGFACVMNGKVSDFHGLTVGNIDTSSISGATEEERSMIKNLFSQGVWLP